MKVLLVIVVSEYVFPLTNFLLFSIVELKTYHIIT